MTKIAEIAQKAHAVGMSYGQYVAAQWMKSPKKGTGKKCKKLKGRCAPLPPRP